MKHIHTIITVFAALLIASCGKDETLPQESIDITTQDDDRTTATLDSTYTYKLPVIFHVLYTEDNDSVRALSRQLTGILSYVNELYKGNVYGWSSTYSEDINVDFQPATSDEKGNVLSTPGVEFVKWNGTFPIEASSFMSKGHTDLLWEPNEYINVMVYPFEQNTEGSVILGISHMPYTLNDSTLLDGLETTKSHYISKNNLSFPYCVSINSQYVHTMSTRYFDSNHGSKGYQYFSADIVATLAHELGHYLGLHHVFTEEKKSSGGHSSWSEVNDCYDSDFCDDTPSYNKVEYDDSLDYYTDTRRENYVTPTMTTLTRRHSCDGTLFHSYNIMDYSVGYAFRFTPEQKARMRHVLYYSPLIPGPKRNHVNTMTRAAEVTDSIIDLPIVITQ